MGNIEKFDVASGASGWFGQAKSPDLIPRVASSSWRF